MKGGKGEPGYPGDSGILFEINNVHIDIRFTILLGTPGQRGTSGEKGDRGISYHFFVNKVN